MRQKTESKIMETLYENPTVKFTMRELTKKTGLPRATVHKYIQAIKKQKLITEENSAEDSLFFKIKKIDFFVEKIVSCGLIEFLVNELNPSCIILFGSIRKGDSNLSSDIDLFVESSSDKKINVEKYESKLRHKIELFVEKKISDLPEHLFNNVVNGIKIYGSFKVK